MLVEDTGLRMLKPKVVTAQWQVLVLVLVLVLWLYPEVLKW